MRPRRAALLACLACSLVAALACSPAHRRLSDGEKRQRIEAIYQEYKESFPEVPDVTTEELVGLLQTGGVVLVDVRTPEEQEVSMIPGAITSEAFDEHRSEHRGATVVAYCTIGYRSGLWARELRRHGWDARNLRGSILSWTHAGRPLRDALGPTRRLHVYGAKWDLAAEGYETVW